MKLTRAILISVILMFSMEAAMAQANDTTQVNTKKLPTWVGGKKGNDPQNKPGGYGYQPKKKQDEDVESSWWQRVKDRLNNPMITPSSLGGGNSPTPNFNTPDSLKRPDPQSQPGGYGYQPAFSTAPTWLQNIKDKLNDPLLAPSSLGGGNAPIPNFNATPFQPKKQNGGGGGDLAFGPDGQTFTIGEDAINQTPGVPYSTYNGVKIPHVFNQPTGAPGRTMTGDGVAPGTLDPALWDVPATTGGGGFGTNYGWGKGGGGGGWGGGSYGGYSKKPAWLNQMMRLYSWNIK